MKKKIAIIGSGPAALMLAISLNESVYDITIYEKNFALGRKFLVAGDGGFNLTHSEDIELFIKRYSPPEFLAKSLSSFNNVDLRAKLKALGIETFVGSSKRVYPIKGVKPITVLNAFIDELNKKNISIKTLHQWHQMNDEGGLEFLHRDKSITKKADYTIFALGGSSWSKTGSDGQWVDWFRSKHIHVVPFEASNCNYRVLWDADFILKHEGDALKNIGLSCGYHKKLGELTITQFGLEGGPIYALSPTIREQIKVKGFAEVYIDLKPSHSEEELLFKMNGCGIIKVSEILKNVCNLSNIQRNLLKSLLNREEYLSFTTLSKKIKALPIKIESSASLDEAISTVGGLAREEVNENFELLKMPNCFAIGEMLDWDAPTGGYLLQGCFSMGYKVADFLNKKSFD